MYTNTEGENLLVELAELGGDFRPRVVLAELALDRPFEQLHHVQRRLVKGLRFRAEFVRKKTELSERQRTHPASSCVGCVRFRQNLCERRRTRFSRRLSCTTCEDNTGTGPPRARTDVIYAGSWGINVQTHQASDELFVRATKEKGHSVIHRSAGEL